MQTIQIDGTFTFANNIKQLKIGDKIKLIPNPNNKINSEAVGAYTINGLKIGYVPFKTSQIDINAKYSVFKIKLSQSNPILLITREFEETNFIECEPDFIKEIKYRNNKIKTNIDLKHFYNYLVHSGNEITNLYISYYDLNYINLYISTPDTKAMYQTVTRKYYEDNIFKYDEFYKFKLTPKCIFQEFQIHRLEVYLERKYKSINSLLKKKKFKFDSIVNLKIFDNLEKLNYGFEQLQIDIKPVLNINELNKYINNSEQLDNLIKLIIQYSVKQNIYYDPNNYIKYINSNNNFSDIINNNDFIDSFNNIKLGGLCYNHELKYYCSIDLYDDNNIIEVYTKEITNDKIIELLFKLIISNKNIINIYNPIKGILLKLEIPELIRNNFIKFIST